MNNDDNFIIKMEKYSKKVNNIPDYSVSILPDGTILYKGTENINSSKIQHKISEGSLGQLIDEFIDIYFFALNDKYTNDTDNNMPKMEISVKWQNKHKKVVFDNSSQVPTRLAEFQKLIEKTLGISQSST